MEENLCAKNCDVLPVNGTDNREAHPEGWFVARVKMNCERKYAEKIATMGYETYVPVREEIHQWSDRKKKVDKILIPLVIFFRADEAGSKEVQRLPFVYDLMKAPGERKAARIPDRQIRQLKFMIGNCDGEISISERAIKVGDCVRVVRGSLKGLEGYATSSPDGKAEISIVIENLFCASVKINRADLELINDD